MAGAVGLLSVVVGAVVAYASERFPTHVESLETGAGFLLLSGLALSGYALPAVL
jgi:ABC-type Fe3+ transport system permease subunit